MAIQPEKVVRRYESCYSRGVDSLLKQVFLKMMVRNWSGDKNLAKHCSEILSAIDADSVQELGEAQLALLDKHLIRSH